MATITIRVGSQKWHRRNWMPTTYSRAHITHTIVLCSMTCVAASCVLACYQQYPMTRASQAVSFCTHATQDMYLKTRHLCSSLPADRVNVHCQADQGAPLRLDQVFKVRCLIGLQRGSGVYSELCFGEVPCISLFLPHAHYTFHACGRHEFHARKSVLLDRLVTSGHCDS